MILKGKMLDEHNNIKGLQGGKNNEYYHLSAEQFSYLQEIIEQYQSGGGSSGGDSGGGGSGGSITNGIYGARWGATVDPAWERTDDAVNFADPVPYVNDGVMTADDCSSPFDNIYPWCEMRKVDHSGGILVKIPKFWYKLEAYGTGGLSIKIAPRAVDGFYVSPAHMDRGDGVGERDVIYVGRYHCSSNNYKSETGVIPLNTIKRDVSRTNIHNLGSTIWQWDFATLFTIWLLYFVEFADWNSQAKIGYGCGNNSSHENTGASDTMPYHTGTMQSARTEYGVGVQYRNIEDLWGNVYDWIDGCYNNSSGLNLIKNPADFSDTTGGNLVGLPINGWSSAFAISDENGYPMFYPTEADGSDSTFSCDFWNFNSVNPFIRVGGAYNQSLYSGLFYISCGSNASPQMGTRLMELPDNT